MPPLPASPVPSWNPRIICYFQTYYRDDEYVSLLPLVTNPSGVTHVILAAIHINWEPQNITLNDDPPDHPKYTQLWVRTPKSTYLTLLWWLKHCPSLKTCLMSWATKA